MSPRTDELCADGALPDDPHELEALLADWRWLGELARRLVFDPERADDARQTAWLDAASRSKPERPGRDRLRRALRRALWNGRRGDARRRHRESLASTPEALPSTAELIARGEQQRRVWTELQALDEPYRTTLLLHFQDGLAPTEIAQRSGLAPDSVRARIRRGVELLRERLRRDEAGGGLRALALAVPGVPAVPAVP
ncbi:MAG: sigma-70 family RNA polymerase sigma factor, partial [Planctomycetota bacterium]